MRRIISIEGMSCGNCVKHVITGLEKIEGVTNVEVDLKSGKAYVSCNEAITDDKLKEAVEDMGYDVTGIE